MRSKRKLISSPSLETICRIVDKLPAMGTPTWRLSPWSAVKIDLSSAFLITEKPKLRRCTDRKSELRTAVIGSFPAARRRVLRLPRREVTRLLSLDVIDNRIDDERL